MDPAWKIDQDSYLGIFCQVIEVVSHKTETAVGFSAEKRSKMAIWRFSCGFGRQKRTQHVKTSKISFLGFSGRFCEWAGPHPTARAPGTASRGAGHVARGNWAAHCAACNVASGGRWGRWRSSHTGATRRAWWSTGANHTSTRVGRVARPGWPGLAAAWGRTRDVPG